MRTHIEGGWVVAFNGKTHEVYEAGSVVFEDDHVVHAGAGFPKEVTMVGRSIDASTWPTAQQLADTLATWHEAAEIARTAWARLPRETRSSMPPPP